MIKRLCLLLALCLLPMQVEAQSTMLFGGATTAGHAPIAAQSSGPPVFYDSGPAGGNQVGQGLSEFNQTNRGTGTGPFANNGTGPLNTHSCFQDNYASTANYHYLCLDANAQGGGLLTYGAAGTASPLPFSMNINGVTLPFPFVLTGVVGPSTSVVNDLACWNNTVGTLLKDCGTLPSVGGTSGQIQYNNAGAFGGFTASGDASINTSTGAVTVSKIGGQTISLAGSLTTAGAFTTAGANAFTLTTTTTTNVTLPASGTGTLATLAGTEALTNKTYNGNTWTSGTGTLAIAAGKTLTASNTLTFSGTDSSTLNIGSGGTLGTAAFTAASAYMPSGVQVTNTLSGDVNLNNTSNYFDGPSVTQGVTGTWFASGSVTVVDTAGAAGIFCKLWDGTTVIASGASTTQGANSVALIALSGYLAAPAANIKISCRDPISTSGKITFNASGNSKDATLSAFRVQ